MSSHIEMNDIYMITNKFMDCPKRVAASSEAWGWFPLSIPKDFPFEAATRSLTIDWKVEVMV